MAGSTGGGEATIADKPKITLRSSNSCFRVGRIWSND